MQNKEKLVYLAGPITGADNDAIMAWRKEAQREFAVNGITALTPIDVSSQGVDLKKLAILRDKIDVTRCHVVLMNLLGAKRVSIGTMAELGWANAFGKPIVLVMEESGNLHEHGFVRELSTFHHTTLQDALETVKGLLQGN